MKLNFTEFSYGYSFTENLIRSTASGPTTAPVFPNLVQEAQLGYDVKLNFPGVPVFFQFKLPELMVRETAKEISQHGLSGLHAPFFRMSLMRRDLSDQHKHLIDLESSFPSSVFYATPLVADNGSFNAAYCTANVHRRSVLFSPQDIGPLPDNKNHTVAYSDTSPSAWFCSEPKEINRNSFEALTTSLAERLSERSSMSLQECVAEVRRDIDPFLSSELRNAEGQIRERISTRRAAIPGTPDVEGHTRAVSIDLLVVRELSRVGLGVNLLMAQARN